MFNRTGTPPISHAPMHPLVQFALKTVIVMVAVTLALMLLFDRLVSDVNDALTDQVANVRYALLPRHELGESGTLTRIERLLDRAVALSDTVPPERQQKMVDDIRILATRARPFVLAAQSAFAEPSQAAPQKDR